MSSPQSTPLLSSSFALRSGPSPFQPETAALAAAERVLSAVARGDIETVEEEVGKESALGGVRGVYNSRGQACMHIAAAYGKTKMIEWLADSGCNPSESLAHVGMTPLHLAVLNGRADAVRELIKAGANINSRDSHGMTPLTCATLPTESHVKEIEIARAACKKILLANGAR
ncbi:conserved hypothetical protein [Perkinsus marinus ATCC 50983]|uniref:Uncharacterized protein n=1 Tax=Perkinsus marinus (strain ATCC 50983 / TXsc) TaxID=423536 RepID=C5KP84_PERM5|nr:conserved hypothetical protein [Perkinsus marinus ATCC 50983]EER13691.1 conserved hypothetical protein [Perkinsus marinus ATCC 50983]|eukprot:XP_002781896.1 conserved hypothetical protein [Perkinsus marinus ATCC 50983]